jgi:hypothetical protein
MSKVVSLYGEIFACRVGGTLVSGSGNCQFSWTRQRQRRMITTKIVWVGSERNPFPARDVTSTTVDNTVFLKGFADEQYVFAYCNRSK